MRKNLLLSILIMLSISNGYGQDGEKTAGYSQTIRGTVVDQFNKQGLPGATIQGQLPESIHT